MDVSGKVALVTGGGRGIGRGIVLVLARNGADVVVADINPKDTEAVAAEVTGMGRQSMAVRMDVTDQKSVDDTVQEVIARFGRIDILVNNAGIIAAAGWERRDSLNEDDWDEIYAINVKGLARATNAVVPHMKERRYGKIVNIASIAGRTGTQTMGPYGASKAGVINLTQSAAIGLAPFDINVNAICPGLLWTPMHERIEDRKSRLPENTKGLSPRELFDRDVEERVPLGREQTPEDIGNAVAFFASDHAKNITGQALNISGGTHMN